jgi:uncharacterized iron-regulated membrane protein
MTDQPEPRRTRRTGVLLVSALVLVIAAVTVIGLLTAGRAVPASTATPVAQGSVAASASAGAGASSPAASASASAKSAKAPKVVPSKASTRPTPQATKTATIAKPAAVPIKQELTAAVTKMTAVTGTADGPGEIGGPSVRFTITITNHTGKAFSLSNTVVNAYYGKSATPAVQLRSPGGKDFPSSVKNGGSATGVFVFNIPKASRSAVKVTVDTSVQNPVIAFQGAAPRG